MIKPSHAIIALFSLVVGVNIGKCSTPSQLKDTTVLYKDHHYAVLSTIDKYKFRDKFKAYNRVLLLAKEDLEDCKQKKKCIVECKPCSCPLIWMDSTP